VAAGEQDKMDGVGVSVVKGGARLDAFHELMDAAPVFMWLSDADGRCTFLSRSWHVLTGQRPEQSLGWGWLHAIHPDDGDRVAEAFASARAECLPYQVEYRLLNKSGGYRWMLDSAAPRLAEDGALLGYVGSIVDNEERKAAELALEHGERRARVAAEAANLGIWEWDLRSNLFSLSKQARQIFGLPSDGEEVTQKLLQELVHPDDLPEVRRLSASALDPGIRGREPYRYRIYRASDEAVRWIMAHGEAFFDDAVPPNPVSYIGTFQDVTEQVEFEHQVIEGEARLRMAMDAGGLAVWELDTTTSTITPSPELNALFGFSADALPTAEDLRARYAPGERERVEKLGAEAVARGETRLSVEVRLVLPDDTSKWVLIQAQMAAPMGRAAGRVIGVAMDITGQKQAEERLAIIARELQHRVKNSLTIVQALAAQSFRGERNVEESLAAFTQRLRALASTADVVTRNWTSADLRDLVHRATQPYRESDADPFDISGKSILLPGKHITTIGMALHELSTNAVKYGALSVPGGRVRLFWEAGHEEVAIQWVETGGPPVQPPSGRGFGTRLLRSGLFNREEGSVELAFPPDGVSCLIRVKLGSIAGTVAS
jgi:PAS domain S-box-containing protein